MILPTQFGLIFGPQKFKILIFGYTEYPHFYLLFFTICVLIILMLLVYLWYELWNRLP